MKNTKLSLMAFFLILLSGQLLAAFENVELEPVAFGSKVIGADAADIDHDGDLDFLSYQSYFSHLHLTVNNGSALATFYLTNYANDGKFIDFDGDGYADIANVFNYGPVGQHGLQLRQNNGAGSFGSPSTTSNTNLGTSLNNISSMAAGDFDNDGDQDLVLAGSRWSQKLIVLANDGTGNFTEHFVGTWGNGQTNDATEVQFADFDSDGDLDIFLTAQTWGNGPLPMVWENTGTGFTPAYSEPVGAATFLWTADASVADVDGDGDLDIIAQGSGIMGTAMQGIVLYENLGSFSFAGQVIYDQTGQSLGGVRAADMDYDGDMDLVTTTGVHWGGADNQRLMIMENQGSLTFVPGFEGSQTTGTLATIVNSVSWVGDAEGDGDNEVLTGEYYAGFLWGFNSPPPEVVCTPAEQTFTIFGANGNVGDIDPYSQSLPAGATEWQPVYLTGWHPWGFIPGTNSWVNFDPDDEVGLNTRTPYRIRFEVPEDFTNASMTFNLKADNRALIWVNDTFIDSVDGQGSPSIDATIADEALHPGLNEIRLTMVDWGGIVGFNYRIDVTMTSCEDITDAVLTPDEASQLNQAPMADAGPDQNSETASVTLDGSGSNDPDANLLTYSWSINGNEVATGVNPTITLADGSYTILLTVSDGELTDTDEVTIVVATNQPPVAVAGDDQSFDCVIGSVDVNLDGSASSDPDGDALTYSWSLGGTEVSTTAAFTASLTPGDYTYTLTVDDGNGETATDDVVVSVEADTEAPTLTLLGDNPASVQLYTEYTEGGYEAVDVCDDDVTVVISGSIDFSVPGEYTLTYTATDASGNSAAAERVVEVVNTAPIVANPVADFSLSYGTDFLTAVIDLAGVFADADTSDVLTYSMSNDNDAAVTATLDGSVLTLTVVDLGSSLVSISAVDPWGADASQSFTVTVDVTADLAGALLFGIEKIKIKKEVEVNSGNIIVNEVYGGQDDDDDEDDDGGLGRRGRGGNNDDDDDEDDDNDDDGDHDNDDGDHGHFELKIDKDTHVAAGYLVKANRIQIKEDALIESDVTSNELDNRGDITGQIESGLSLPVFVNLPPFKSAPAGSQNITVNKNQSLTLAPGDYGRITVKDRGTLTFSGGVYNIEKLEAKKQSHIRFEERSEVRVEDEVKFSKEVYVGPAGGSFIDASDIIFYVAGDHGHSAKLYEDVEFYGTIYAQQGKVEIKKEVLFTGSVLAEEISVDKESNLTVNGWFAAGGAGLAKGDRTAWVEPEMAPEIPETIELSQNYPNPFNPSTTIAFNLVEDASVKLTVYDVRGAQVAVLAQGHYNAGTHNLEFKPEGLASGTYLYVLETGSFREVHRMVYLK